MASNLWTGIMPYISAIYCVAVINCWSTLLFRKMQKEGVVWEKNESIRLPRVPLLFLITIAQVLDMVPLRFCLLVL